MEKYSESNSGHTNISSPESIAARNPDNISKNDKTISLELLVRLYEAGFRKLVSTHADSKRANVYVGLITDDVIKQFPSAEGKPVRISGVIGMTNITVKL